MHLTSRRGLRSAVGYKPREAVLYPDSVAALKVVDSQSPLFFRGEFPESVTVDRYVTSE